MYDTVLLPTDGSEPAARAAAHGAALASLFDATVHVLGVVDLQSAAGPFNVGGVDDAFVDRLESEAEDAVDATSESMEGAVTVHTAVEKGRPAETIVKYGRDHSVDLIAMGTHGRTGLHRYVAGSVTERVLRLSTVPVLTTRVTERSTDAGEYDEILVPTDGSQTAAEAVDHAIAIAERTDARIHVVSVVDIGALAGASAEALPPDLFDTLETSAEDAVEKLSSRVREAGVDVLSTVEVGRPAKTVRSYTTDNEIDLVVMGTSGHSGLDRFLLGSTTEHVVRRSECPVIAIPPSDITG